MVKTSRLQAVFARIYRSAAQELSKLMDTRNMYIALYDAKSGMIEFPLYFERGQLIADEQKVHEHQAAPRRLGERNGLTDWVIKRKKPLLIEKEFEKETKRRGIQAFRIGTQCWLGAPMMLRGKVIGVIGLQNFEQEGVFDTGHRDLLLTIASQAAVAIENARLYADLENANIQLASLQKIGVKITSELELDEVLAAIAENANTIMRADFSTLFPYDPEHATFERGTRKGKIEDSPHWPSGTGLASHVAKDRTLIFAHDARDYLDEQHPLVQGYGLKSFAGVPLVFHGKTVGVLFIDYLHVHQFSFQEEQILALLANQAAVAIVNARLYKAQLDARQREKLALLGEVAAGLIHKMSNTLGHIPTLTERIGKSINSKDESVMTKLTRIRQGAEDALAYTSEMGRILELESVSMENADIKALVDDALRQVLQNTHTDSQTIELETQYTDEYLIFPVNSTLLIEALRNILQNAVDAMPKGGRLAVIIEKTGNERVRIKIKDHGCGIPEEKRAQIFSPGFSSKGGKGLGLWFAKTIVGQHHGEISFESNVNRGTTFDILLPMPHLETTEEVVRWEVSHVQNSGG